MNAGFVTSSPKTGAELVGYWQDEGLIGTRPDIDDSQEYARTLRAIAERLWRRRVDQLFDAADRLAALPEPLTDEEIEAEIKAARDEKRSTWANRS